MPSPEAMLLECRSLRKSFSGVAVLRDGSLTVRAGAITAVMGENGAGKSTLMNLIGGVHQPDAGEMTLRGEEYRPSGPLDAARHGIAFVHQELNLFTNLPVWANVFLHERPSKRHRERTRELLERLGLEADPDALVETLPAGERQLVEIAKALQADARLIIFDEPTTSLSGRETGRLFELIRRLRDEGIAIVFISHAIEDVLQLADEVAVLRDGEAVAAKPASEWTRQELIQAMVGRPIHQLYPTRHGAPAAEVALEAEGLSQPGVVEKVSFRLNAGEVLGLAGLMGSGRSELARILFGLDECASGRVRLNGDDVSRCSPRERIRRGMAFLTESRREDGLFLDASVNENLEIVWPGGNYKAVTESLRIVCANADRQPVRQLSGGNQQKVALGKWLIRTPKVLIVDEPTRGIDVGAKHEIYSQMLRLADAGIAVLVISSEIEELMGICDRILAMRRGEVRGEFRREFDREQIMAAAL